MKMLIGGSFVGEGLSTINVFNPATGEKVGTAPDGGENEAKAAIDKAYSAFKTWSKKTANERSKALMSWFRKIEEATEELAELMTKEQGKPLKEAKGEIGYANSFIEWYAEEGKRIYGETIPASAANKRIFVQRQAVGVVAAITPWNFPAAMITRKVAPALAAGCTVVVKPAEQTPLTALRLGELAIEAGIPSGVINIVTGDAKTIAEVWQEDSRVRKLTFTGSTEVGKILMEGASKTMKKISLELGGQAPFIVMDDADLDAAVSHFIASKYRNAGQTCVCANRIYVHEDVVDAFSEKAKAAVSELKVGNGLEEGVDLGPLIDEDAVKKVQEHIEDAKDKGAEVVYGGAEADGQFIGPTVLRGVTEEMKCMREETFGPLAPISTFKTEEEVIERANGTPFGLAAYLFTRDIGKAVRLSEELEFGIVGINDGLPSVPQAPFGGFKESGLGREGGHHGMDEFLEVKYISLAF
ncbi:NAD-dependent succinate-semialdehyde dehydrogenase [Alkalihalophilus pseudofirmus]|uniref:NAD-dependent succinate-semialdehyde dehydrogenase n=1 Tax=Alkalihalophilus pseudofirmus TaxID=79885 RepID=UPI00259BBF0E|nr:NAD-dependent succinate-semialdehyde dehydrogenase [Alkalihalophilus pseudofirmus]WEG17540.1 NAD-dependent succinate-semialdehyde dehydrogenase [Alkalihalophilus pseudofirmus]